MKKIMALLLCLVLCFSFVACSSKGKTSLDDYVASIQDEIESMNDADDMNIKVLARDNSLVYRYQYTFDIEMNDDIKSAIESTLAETDSTFESVLKSVREVVPKVKSVIVEYLDKSGDMIYSKEYK